MTDVEVVAVLTAREGAAEQLRTALEQLVDSTRAEKGCISYDLFASTTDPTVFVTKERWRSSDDLSTHLTGPGVRQALTVAEAWLALPPAIHPLDRIA